MTTIPAGAPVAVEGCQGQWCQVSFQGQNGYVIATSIGQGGPPPSGGPVAGYPGGPPPPPPGYYGPPPYPPYPPPPVYYAPYPYRYGYYGPHWHGGYYRHW
jgi:hypothetical protein